MQHDRKQLESSELGTNNGFSQCHGSKKTEWSAYASSPCPCPVAAKRAENVYRDCFKRQRYWRETLTDYNPPPTSVSLLLSHALPRHHTQPLSLCRHYCHTRGQPGRASELSRQMTAFLVRFAQFDVVTGSLHPCGFIIFHSRT